MSHDQEVEGVSEVVEVMQQYDLTREDWDSIIELAHYPGGPEVTSLIVSKVW